MNKLNEIEMRDIVNFCEEYNAIGYGNATIKELSSKFILKLYNAGYSENEHLDFLFKQRHRVNMILEYHPISIF